MTKIAFTSCMRVEAFPRQPQWLELKELKPDHLLLLGDNIYMDYWPYKKTYAPSEFSDELFREWMNDRYSKQWNEQHFKALIDQIKSTSGGVFGTWDDHDFAWDNAVGTDVPDSKKVISRRLFNKWVYDVEQDFPVYRYFDTEHARVIILDQRSFSEPKSNTADLIGESQLDFLEQSLNHSKQFTIVCGGLPMTLAPTFLSISLKFSTTRWNSYQEEFRRFSELIKERDNVVYLGGDIHQNAFAKPLIGVRPCYEVIVSGMAVDTLASQVTFNSNKPERAYDSVSNWGMLDISQDKLIVTQSSKKSFFKRKYKQVEIPAK